MAIFIKSLKEHGLLDSLQMTVGIVGSRKLSEQDDYGQQGWHYFGQNLTIYGFDADTEACEVANAEIAARSDVTWNEIHIPLALGRSCGEQTLYVTNEPMCSSLYPPNEQFMARFDGLKEMAGLDFEVEIETTTLDQFCESESIEEIDFLQIDVQGADLDVLHGAIHLLSRSVLGIQIEVEFAELYKGQPLFADIDTFLRKQNFSLFDLCRSYLRRVSAPITSAAHPGQILWGEGFYLRDLLSGNDGLLKFQSPQQLLKLACITDILDFTDYTVEILEHLMLQETPENKRLFATVIVESFSRLGVEYDRDFSDLPVIQRILSTFDDMQFPCQG
ncbi:MAG: FkbM family methyltransferase [Thermosynechococcaceae cyanobacterium MS004]|nr:FkbM family methyltransferase [Thermosynechococcaceae cyanobacterium MS004]